MTHRILSGELRCLRIYVGESDNFHHKPVWKQVLEKARESGIAGCTVVGGMLGFGAGRRIHSDFPPEQAIDLPILIEVVDEPDRIETFLQSVEPMLSGTLVTEERAFVHHYQAAQVTTTAKRED
jgi:PII-like signaling protein